MVLEKEQTTVLDTKSTNNTKEKAARLHQGSPLFYANNKLFLKFFSLLGKPVKISQGLPKHAITIFRLYD